MTGTKPVGIIGLGLMGSVYVQRLIGAGFRVLGFDVDAEKNALLGGLGGQACSLLEIARDCDPIIIAVFDTDQVEEVVHRALVPAAQARS